MITSACSSRSCLPCRDPFRLLLVLACLRSPLGDGSRRHDAADAAKRARPRRNRPGYAARDDVRAFIGEMATEYGFDRAKPHASISRRRVTSPRSSSRWIARCWSPRSGTSTRARSFRRSAWPRGLRTGTRTRTISRAREERYGVPAEIIVAIIGVETFYGKVAGNYPRAGRADDARFRLPPARRVLSRRAEAVPVARARARDAAGSGEGIVRRRDGRAAVHAGKLSHLCRRLRRQRAAGSLAESRPTSPAASPTTSRATTGSRGRPILLPAAIADDKRDAILRKLDGGLSERRAAEAWAADGVSVADRPPGPSTIRSVSCCSRNRRMASKARATGLRSTISTC